MTTDARTRPRRPEVSEFAWAFAFALWCVAWPLGLVAAVGSTPGVLSGRGDTGLREAVDVLLPMSYPAALFLWAILAFATMWGLLRLRRWLDPNGISGAAIRWALSSRSLNLTAVGLLIVPLSLAVAEDSIVAQLGRVSPEAARFLVMWWWPIVLIAVLIVAIAAMLCLLNPQTLARDRLERWWRPFWPGVAALAVALVCWEIAPTLMESQLEFVQGSMSELWALMLDVLDYWLVVVLDLIAFAYWFSRGHWPDAKIVGKRLFEWRALGGYLGLELLIVSLALVPAVPVVLLAAFVIYIAPQYAARQEAGIQDMPAPVEQVTAWVQHAQEGALILVLLGVGLLLAVARGRLLFRYALGGDSRLPAGDGVDGAGR